VWDVFFGIFETKNDVVKKRFGRRVDLRFQSLGLKKRRLSHEEAPSSTIVTDSRGAVEGGRRHSVLSPTGVDQEKESATAPPSAKLNRRHTTIGAVG
jgi:hypothetical protein